MVGVGPLTRSRSDAMRLLALLVVFFATASVEPAILSYGQKDNGLMLHPRRTRAAKKPCDLRPFACCDRFCAKNCKCDRGIGRIRANESANESHASTFISTSMAPSSPSFRTDNSPTTATESTVAETSSQSVTPFSSTLSDTETSTASSTTITTSTITTATIETSSESVSPSSSTSIEPVTATSTAFTSTSTQQQPSTTITGATTTGTSSQSVPPISSTATVAATSTSIASSSPSPTTDKVSTKTTETSPSTSLSFTSTSTMTSSEFPPTTTKVHTSYYANATKYAEAKANVQNIFNFAPQGDIIVYIGDQRDYSCCCGCNNGCERSPDRSSNCTDCRSCNQTTECPDCKNDPRGTSCSACSSSSRRKPCCCNGCSNEHCCFDTTTIPSNSSNTTENSTGPPQPARAETTTTAVITSTTTAIPDPTTVPSGSPASYSTTNAPQMCHKCPCLSTLCQPYPIPSAFCPCTPLSTSYPCQMIPYPVIIGYLPLPYFTQNICSCTDGSTTTPDIKSELCPSSCSLTVQTLMCDQSGLIRDADGTLRCAKAICTEKQRRTTNEETVSSSQMPSKERRVGNTQKKMANHKEQESKQSSSLSNHAVKLIVIAIHVTIEMMMVKLY